MTDPSEIEWIKSECPWCGKDLETREGGEGAYWHVELGDAMRCPGWSPG